MSARIDICNMALSFIGAGLITSLDDGTDESRAMKAVYYLAKDAMLEDANWTFAMKRWKPAASGTAPAFGWSYAYPVPSDIHRVVAVLRSFGTQSVWPYSTYDFPEETLSAHVIESGEILSNDNPIYCYGIRKMEDEGSYSPLFVEAFGYKLAYMVSMPLAASTTKMQSALALYGMLMKRAKTRDSMQNSTRRVRSSVLRDTR